MLLVSNVSQRRSAELLGVTRKTIARKFFFLGMRARIREEARLDSLPDGCIQSVQFDEMQSFEKSKCLPLSIPLIVHVPSRLILGFSVASMPATGPLAALSRKKYGSRVDRRKSAAMTLLKRFRRLASSNLEILTDQNPHYPIWLKKTLPAFRHTTVKGRRGCVVGQGELKRGGFDPLFALNHTAAMKRANINRLNRRTWCTTKKAANLALHLWIYTEYHNEVKARTIA
jgi:hypothetical protein